MTLLRLFISVFMFTAVGFAAQAFEVTKVNGTSTRVIVENNGEIHRGDTMKFTDGFAETCYALVLKTTTKTAILDISDCNNAKSISVGSNFEKSEKTVETVNKSGGPTINEPWYTLWGLGFSNISYNDDDLEDAIDDAEDSPGVDRTTLSYDLFGFFWPLSDQKSMQGFVVSGAVDSLDGPGGTLDIRQYTYSYSFQKFFGANIGDGWFLRGDAGFTRASVTAETFFINGDAYSDWGTGFLAGGGYGFALGRETRLLLGLYFATRKADDFKTNTTHFNFGFLF